MNGRPFKADLDKRPFKSKGTKKGPNLEQYGRNEVS